jgi:hypothetical protein
VGKDAVIKEKEDRIKELETEAISVRYEVNSWKCLIEDLITQFQKFVNYSLKSDSGNAEFVLSLEKVLAMRENLIKMVSYLRVIQKVQSTQL